MAFDPREVAKQSVMELEAQGFVANRAEEPWWKRGARKVVKQVYYKPEDPNAVVINKYGKFITGETEYSIAAGIRRYHSGEYSSSLEILEDKDGRRRPSVVFRDNNGRKISAGSAAFVNPFVDTVHQESTTNIITVPLRESPNNIVLRGVGRITISTEGLVYMGDPAAACAAYGSTQRGLDQFNGPIVDTNLDELSRDDAFGNAAEKILEAAKDKGVEPAPVLENFVSASLVGKIRADDISSSTGVGLIKMAVVTKFSSEIQEFSDARAQAEKTRIEGGANADIAGQTVQRTVEGFVKGLGVNPSELISTFIKARFGGGSQ